MFICTGQIECWRSYPKFGSQTADTSMNDKKWAVLQPKVDGPRKIKAGSFETEIWPPHGRSWTVQELITFCQNGKIWPFIFIPTLDPSPFIFVQLLCNVLTVFEAHTKVCISHIRFDFAADPFSQRC